MNQWLIDSYLTHVGAVAMTTDGEPAAVEDTPGNEEQDLDLTQTQATVEDQEESAANALVDGEAEAPSAAVDEDDVGVEVDEGAPSAEGEAVGEEATALDGENEDEDEQVSRKKKRKKNRQIENQDDEENSDGATPVEERGEHKDAAGERSVNNLSDDDADESIQGQLRRAIKSILRDCQLEELTLKATKKKLKKIVGKKAVKKNSEFITQYLVEKVTQIQTGAVDQDDAEEAADDEQAQRDADQSDGNEQQEEDEDGGYEQAEDEPEDDEYVDSSARKRLKKNKIPKKSSSKKNKKGGPKKALSAYFIFQNENRARVREDNPDIGGQAQLVGKLAEMWRAMSDEEKAPYVEKAEDGKREYERELQELRENDPDLYASLTAKKKRKGESTPRKKVKKKRREGDEGDGYEGSQSEAEEEKEQTWFERTCAELKSNKRRKVQGFRFRILLSLYICLHFCFNQNRTKHQKKK